MYCDSLLDSLRETKVGEFDVTLLCDEQIFRLEISVHDTITVNVLQSQQRLRVIHSVRLTGQLALNTVQLAVSSLCSPQNLVTICHEISQVRIHNNIP